MPEELLEYYQSIDLSPILNGNESERHKDTVARVFAMVENIDENMGKLDQYLKESGQFENTLVMFFTDNGPNTMRYVGPFRGMKSHVHEGGIRTMFYARWPKGFEAGTKSDRIAAHIDLMPTMMELAGFDPPADLALDGKSVVPLLKGKSEGWPDRNLFIQARVEPGSSLRSRKIRHRLYCISSGRIQVSLVIWLARCRRNWRR